MYPLVRELVVDGIPVTVTCRVLKIARQPYYRWLANPVTPSELEEAYRADALFDAHRDDPSAATGSWPMRPATPAWAWPSGPRGGSARTMAGSAGWGRRSAARARRVGPPVHDDLVRRDFTADVPNRLWLADITEHHTGEGKLYLCAIKDEFSNRIVGYSIDSRIKAHLAVAAVNNAVARRGDVAGCILHTDRGSQFRSRKLQRSLNRHHLVG